MEADVCPLHAPEKIDTITGSIGEITVFQDTFGYYAHGLPPEACPLPRGWQDRLISRSNENTPGVTMLLLHPDDLACSKLAAGREKDIEFVAAMLAHRMVHADRLSELSSFLGTTEHRTSAERNLRRAVRRSLEIPSAADPPGSGM